MADSKPVALSRGISVARSAHISMQQEASQLWASAEMLSAAGQPEAAEARYLRLLRLDPQHIGALLALARLAAANGATESAILYTAQAGAASPGNRKIAANLRLLLKTRATFDWREELGQAAALLSDDLAAPAERYAAALTLMRYGAVIGLQSEFEALSSTFPRASEMARMVHQMERTGLARPRPVIGDNMANFFPDSAVTEFVTPGADTLVLVFGGGNHRGGLSFEIIHRILRSAGVNILYLRDFERTWFTGGIIGLGDSFRATVATLQDKIATLGVAHVRVIGTCIGGAGALRYGMALNAGALLGLGARLNIPDILLDQPCAQGKILRDPADPLLTGDISCRYAAMGGPAMTLIYGAEHGPDAEDALHFAGIAGVTHIGITDFAGHSALALLFRRGLLTRLLNRFVRIGAVDPGLRADIEAAARVSVVVKRL